MTKDESIWRFLARLAAAGDPRQWQVVDHWDADRVAIGIASASDPRQLVYVSTHNLPPGLYFYECESAPPPGSDRVYVTARQGNRADFSHLLSVIREHLGIDLNERG